MTKKSSKVTLAIKNISEDEMSISVNVEGLKPDHAAAEMVARALGHVFSFDRWEHWETHTEDGGAYIDGIITHENGRRLFVSIPATETAFDGETGKALAEAWAWLKGEPRVTFLAAGDVIEIRAILRGEKLPRKGEETTLAVMEEFGLGRDDANSATNFFPNVHESRRRFIRGGDNTV